MAVAGPRRGVVFGVGCPGMCVAAVEVALLAEDEALPLPAFLPVASLA